MKSQSRHNSTKKGLINFFTVTLRPFIKYHSAPKDAMNSFKEMFPLARMFPLAIMHLSCFPSRNITKNVKTHPPPMRDVIIE